MCVLTLEETGINHLMAFDVVAFNKMRAEHPDWKPSYPDTTFWRADLRGVNLRGANLTNVCFQEAALCGADFSFACVRNGNFYGACLERVSFLGANLQGAILALADLSAANLWQAEFDGARGLHEARHLLQCNLPAAGGVPREAWEIYLLCLRDEKGWVLKSP